MQEYVEIPRNKSLRDSRELILNNDKTIASHYSGTAFPSQYLAVGMECYRTDLKAKYRLTKTNPATWEPVLTAAEIAKVKVNNAKAADYADNAGKVSGYYVAKDVPANAVFTDTWRPVEDRLTSTSPINALSALQGKLLNEQKAPKDSPKLTGKPTAPTPPAASNDDQIATTKFARDVVTELIQSGGIGGVNNKLLDTVGYIEYDFGLKIMWGNFLAEKTVYAPNSGTTATAEYRYPIKFKKLIFKMYNDNSTGEKRYGTNGANETGFPPAVYPVSIGLEAMTVTIRCGNGWNRNITAKLNVNGIFFGL